MIVQASSYSQLAHAFSNEPHQEECAELNKLLAKSPSILLRKLVAIKLTFSFCKEQLAKRAIYGVKISFDSQLVIKIL